MNKGLKPLAWFDQIRRMDMTPDEIKSFFHSVYTEGKELYSPEMLDEFYARIAPEFVFHRSPFPDVTGIEANRKSDEDTAVAYSEQKLSVDELLVEGDTAVLRYTWEGVHSGASPSLGIPPTGKRVKVAGCSVYHWKDGKMVEMWDYLDVLGLLQQMGVIPAMA
jgi:predicted ester cyclase